MSLTILIRCLDRVGSRFGRGAWSDDDLGYWYEKLDLCRDVSCVSVDIDSIVRKDDRYGCL